MWYLCVWCARGVRLLRAGVWMGLGAGLLGLVLLGMQKDEDEEEQQQEQQQLFLFDYLKRSNSAKVWLSPLLPPPPPLLLSSLLHNHLFLSLYLFIFLQTQADTTPVPPAASLAQPTVVSGTHPHGAFVVSK